jgi:OmpA-OmpF porin, OOP family
MPKTNPSRHPLLRMKSVALLTACFGTALVATSASAQNFYVGISGGTTKSNVKSEDSTAAIAAARGPSGERFINIVSSDDDKDTAFRVFGGYRIAPFFAVEAHYSDLGKYSLSSSAVIEGTREAATLDSRFKSKGYGVDAVFIAPLAEAFSLYGKVGVMRSDTEGAFSSTGAIAVQPSPPGTTPIRSISRSADRTSPVYGVGVQYDLNKQIGFRADLTRYDRLGNDSTGGKLRVDVLAAGVVVNF